MLSKLGFKSVRQSLFLILLIFTLLFIFIQYKTNDQSTKGIFRQYKEDYYAEQAYTLGYTLGLSATDDLTSPENQQLYRRLSNKFSMGIELLSVDLKQIYYPVDDQLSKETEAFIEMPLMVDGEILAYLRVHYNIDDQYSSPSLMKFQSDLAKSQKGTFVTIGIFVILISFVVSLRATRSLKITSQRAQRILNGEHKLRLPREGTRELNQMIDTINGLLIETNQMEVFRMQMMEDLTHELQTPITSALVTMEAIIDGVYPKTTENIEKIFNELERLSRLITNMQKLSEAERANFKLNYKRTNIGDLVRGTYEGLLFLAKQKDIQMDFKYPTRPIKAEIDHDRFIQVITNIISNALTYTNNGGKVELSLDSDDEHFIFVCSDNGVGISHENQKLIFQRLYRTDKSRSRKQGGSGIGLNIADSLVQAHGGEIGVESQLGEGSTFWVKIPIKNPKLK